MQNSTTIVHRTYSFGYLLLFVMSTSGLGGCGVNFSYRSIIPGGHSVTNLQNGSISQVAPERPRIWNLPSGKSVMVLSISTISYLNAPSARQLVYTTKFPIVGSPELKNEVNEIWQVFQKQVEKSGQTDAIVMAKEAVPSGPNGRAFSHGYGWRKESNGKWKELLPVTK